MPKQSRRRIPLIFGAISIGLGIAAGWFGQDLIHDNDDARDLIVTVFSILAGFLIAVMTLLGDQSLLPGSWRLAQVQRDKIRRKLIRQKWLFYFYLITLSLIFIRILVGCKAPELAIWLERAYFGFATTSFIFSFLLPSTLMQVQSDRIDAVIDARRATASTLDKN